MDFFEHQERARRNTLLLVIYFGLAIVGVILAIYLSAIGIITAVQLRREMPLRLWIPELFFVVTGSALTIIFFGSLYKIAMIGSSGENVALALGGKKLPADTRDLSERILLNVVEEMALASGTPVPPVYLMEAETGINAFAAGTSPQNAVIGITRGALNTLSRDELQGVIAHEFSHILNGDMRLNIRLMGWLHGILVIAMIGYLVLRTFSHTGTSTSSSKKGDGLVFAVMLSGLALVVIGYVGVFFAQLIKAAVSRQREFLADSSAVQFTRNPSGIADALKKIGGWKESSKIASPQAEESSHMFFSNALVSNLFATHPPLAERVKRIEPQFAGSFGKTVSIVHSPSEVIDPRSLAQQLSSGQPPVPRPAHAPAELHAHQAAVDGAQRLADQPEHVIQTVGEPREEHLEHAHEIVDELDPRLLAEVRDPLGAVAIIYALLLAPRDSQFRKTQVALINRSADRQVISELNLIHGLVEALAAEQRLPVACLALPSLHQMSPPQILDFHNLVKGLIHVDQQVTLFEFALQRFINKRLLPRLTGAPAKLITRRSIGEFQPAIAVVLSTLANYGSPQNPRAAFDAGMAVLPGGFAGLQLALNSDCTIQRLDQALDSLESAAPSAKKTMLASFSACIAADQHMTVEEAELLRVIADALGCPVPPIL